MTFSTVITCILFLCTTGWAQYVLEDDYTSDGNFFDQFSFFNAADPTHGFVDYVDKDTAQQSGFIKTQGNQYHMGVGNATTANGMPSVRITSNKSYNSGLVILDLEHMPANACGTWPAFWMVGPDWPSNGEIGKSQNIGSTARRLTSADIIEGVNDQITNAMTLHTGPDCSITNTADMLGSVKGTNCDVKASPDNAGCQITTINQQTYGPGFNDNKGGVYATQWTSSSIQIFFFPRGSIPSDITDGSPNPSSWGKPLANFQGGCDISKSFQDLQIVFDITFCGDWAGGSAWSQSSCATHGTCQTYVQTNAANFDDVFWTVNSLKVYQSNGASESSSSVSAYSATSAYSVSSVVSTGPPYSANASKTIPTYPTEGPTTASAVPVPVYSAPSSAETSTSSKQSHWHHHWTKTAHAMPRAAEPTVGAIRDADGTLFDLEASEHERLHAAHETQSLDPEAATQHKAESERGARKSAQRMARHLRQHKRHGSGRL